MVVTIAGQGSTSRCRMVTERSDRGWRGLSKSFAAQTFVSCMRDKSCGHAATRDRRCSRTGVTTPETVAGYLSDEPSLDATRQAVAMSHCSDSGTGNAKVSPRGCDRSQVLTLIT